MRPLYYPIARLTSNLHVRASSLRRMGTILTMRDCGKRNLGRVLMLRARTILLRSLVAMCATETIYPDGVQTRSDLAN